MYTLIFKSVSATHISDKVCIISYVGDPSPAVEAVADKLTTFFMQERERTLSGHISSYICVENVASRYETHSGTTAKSYAYQHNITLVEQKHYMKKMISDTKYLNGLEADVIIMHCHDSVTYDQQNIPSLLFSDTYKARTNMRI